MPIQAGRPAPPAAAAPGAGMPAAPGVWWFSVRATTLTGPELAVLGPRERARAAAFVYPADRHRYQVAHVALRQVLAGHTGVPPGQLEFRREPCPRCGVRAGRPALTSHRGLYFSISRSADAVAVATAAAPVGIDLERMVRRCCCDLAGSMHAADAALVLALPEPQRHAAIMRWWVAAEAVLKCTGAGIAHGMAQFPLLVNDRLPGAGALGSGPADRGAAAARAADAIGLAGRASGCWLLPLAAPAGYAAAIAVHDTAPAAAVMIRASGLLRDVPGHGPDGGSAKPGPSCSPAGLTGPLPDGS